MSQLLLSNKPSTHTCAKPWYHMQHWFSFWAHIFVHGKIMGPPYCYIFHDMSTYLGWTGTMIRGSCSNGNWWKTVSIYTYVAMDTCRYHATFRCSREETHGINVILSLRDMTNSLNSVYEMKRTLHACLYVISHIHLQTRGWAPVWNQYCILYLHQW